MNCSKPYLDDMILHSFRPNPRVSPAKNQAKTKSFICSDDLTSDCYEEDMAIADVSQKECI